VGTADEAAGAQGCRVLGHDDDDNAVAGWGAWPGGTPAPPGGVVTCQADSTWISARPTLLVVVLTEFTVSWTLVIVLAVKVMVPSFGRVGTGTVLPSLNVRDGGPRNAQCAVVAVGGRVR
jgi:hypothetical protein